MFKGNSGTSSYNAAEGKFNEVDSVLDPVSGELAVPFDYGSEQNFIDRVDLSVAGNMMDCGECHVGGGAMEYVPNPVLADRTPLVDLATVGVEGFGGVADVAAPITAANYTAFNYFIDNYDVDGDGNKTEAQYIDYADTGVMEMDCFMCHLPGYKYEERRDLLRKGKIGALSAVGAGLASENSDLWDDVTGTPAGYGTTVEYDTNVVEIRDIMWDADGDPDTGYYGKEAVLAADVVAIPSGFMGELAGAPDSTNCASCHMNEFSVDWKKRGDHWAPEGQVDFTYEVHYSLGCMGCHERDTADALSWRGDDPQGADAANYSANAPGSLGHDPAKGLMAQYSGLYNKNDNVQFKDCVDCHISGTEGGETYAAPNPNAAHQAAGLTAVVAQGAGPMDGVATKSHMDMMHCSACHSRKIDSYAWGNTGAPMIDATGADHEGRLTDHENVYVTKPDMTDQSSMQWYKGMLRRVQPSATMFWRDKNDTPELDANFDGRPHGMDALLMTDVLAVNEAQGWEAITYDTLGGATEADFAARITALKNYIEAKATNVFGVDKTGTAKIKFSIFHVNFMNQHAVSPAMYAWGSGVGNDPLDPADDNAPSLVDTQYFCNDCHSATSNFYNGFVDTTGPADMTYGASTSQRVPFTKVNGFSQPTDWHPNQFDKFAARSIAIQIANAPDPVNGGLTTRDVQISENMYENTFMTAADFAPSYSSSAAIDFSGFEKGWQLIVQVNDGTERLKMVSTDITDVAGLLANLGTNMTDGTFGFTITDNLAGGITVAGTGGNLVRLKAGNAASFQMTGAAYKAMDWTGVDGNAYAGRTAWTGYLDSITPASVGLGVDPVAVISSVPASVEVGADATLIADETVNTQGTFSYSWVITGSGGSFAADGPVAVVNTLPVGFYSVLLEVTDEEGNVAQATTAIEVVEPAPVLPPQDISSTDNGTGAVQTVTFSNLTDAHTRATIAWGDGTTTSVYTSAETFNMDHTFAVGRRQVAVGGFYSYDVSITLINGRTVGATTTGTILIAE